MLLMPNILKKKRKKEKKTIVRLPKNFCSEIPRPNRAFLAHSWCLPMFRDGLSWRIIAVKTAGSEV